MANPYTDITNYELSVIKAPPVAELLAGGSQNDDLYNYNLIGHVFQFSYRYIYGDDEKSVYGLPTHVIIPFLYGNNIYEMVHKAGVTEHVIIRLKLFLIPSDVNKIEIAVRIDGGIWYYYDRIDITASDITNGYVDYDFANDKIPIALPGGDIIRPYDYVPRLAGSQELINKNIICYGDILMNYDNPESIDIDLTANVAYTEVFHKSLFSGIYSPYNNANIIFHAEIKDRWGNVVDIDFGNALDGVLANYVVYLIANGEYHKVVYNKVENWDTTSAGELASAIAEDSWISSAVLVGATTVIRVTFNSLVDVGAIGIAYRNYGFPLTLRDYAKYYIGMEYLDQFGRVGAVLRNDDMIMDVPSLNSQGLTYNDYISFISYQLNHTPPIWAYSWRWCYATNIVWWMQYLIRPHHNTDQSVFRDEERGLIKIKINQGINDVRDELPNYALYNYIWQKGDRIRLIGTVPLSDNDVLHFPVELIDTSGIGREIDYEILDFDGIYIYVPDFTKDDNFYASPSIVPDIDSADADDILVEIYRIRKDTENLVYKSIPLNTEQMLGGSVQDYDGNVYTTIIVGNQEWMVENLKTTHYKDGTVIPNLTLNADWIVEDGTPGHDGAYCWYDNNIGYKDPYGALYNWYAVDNAHGLAPEGFRISTDADLTVLINFLGGSAIAGGKLKEIGTTHWQTPNTGATNDVGFTALPGGARIESGEFGGINTACYLWSSTSYDILYAWVRSMLYNTAIAYRSNIGINAGFSVRCIRDFDPRGAYGIDNPGTPSRVHASTTGVIQLWNSRLCMLPVANIVSEAPEVPITTTTTTTTTTTSTTTSIYNVGLPLGLKCVVANLPYFGYKNNIIFDQLWDSKINIADPDYKEQRLNNIRYSGPFIARTQINELNRFDYDAVFEMDDKHGKIYGLKEVGNMLKVLQTSKNTSVYIGYEYYVDSDGTTKLISSNKILGSKNPHPEDYGTIFSQSIVKSGRDVFYYDIYSSKIIRDMQNGQQVISLAGIDSYLRTKSKALLASGVSNINVIAGVDQKNGIVYFTFIDSYNSANNETIGYHIWDNKWVGNYIFIPELYSGMGENMFVSFKNGEFWKHNSDSVSRCIFYGAQSYAEIHVVSNINPQVLKQWDSIEIASNKLWTIANNDSIVIDPSTNYPGGMKSKILSGDWAEYEEVFRAAFNYDMLSGDNATANNYYLYNGRELRGRNMLIKLKNMDISEVNLILIKVNSKQSS